MAYEISLFKLRLSLIAVGMVVFHVAGLVGMATGRAPQVLNWINSNAGEGASPEQVALLFGDWFDNLCGKVVLATGTVAFFMPKLQDHIRDWLKVRNITIVRTLSAVALVAIPCVVIHGCGKTAAGFQADTARNSATGKALIGAAALKAQELSSASLTLLGAPLRSPAVYDATNGTLNVESAFGPPAQEKKKYFLLPGLEK